MRFTVLPCVLQDLVLDFAFKITKKELDDDLETIRTIKSWDLDPIFVRHRVWIREQWCFQDNPLQMYIPLQKLENEFSMFDMCLVFELLDRLDFQIVLIIQTRRICIIVVNTELLVLMKIK